MQPLIELLIPRKNHFGLSIGRTSLRGLELDQKGKVKSGAEVFFPEDVFVNGTIGKKDIFIETLKKLLQAGTFSTSYVAVCFSEVYAYTREYSLPLISDTEIHEAVAWHVGELFPFPKDELYFDWRILTKTETEYKIAVVAVQKQVLDPLVEVLTQAGLKPLGFEPGASAITRLLLLKPGQQALVTEINRKGAYVTLVEGEKPIFTTVISLAQEDTPEVYLKNIVAAINEMVDFYTKKHLLNEQGLQIVITGELADGNWQKNLENSIKKSVSMVETELKKPSFNKTFAMAKAVVLPPPDPRSINLLPEKLQKMYDAERSFAFYSTLLVRSIVFASFFAIVAGIAFTFVTITRQTLDNRVKQLSVSTEKKKSETQNLLLLNAQAKNIIALAPLRQTVKDKLLVIQSVLPAGIIISQWEFDDNKQLFTLNGTALTREDLLFFKQKLEQTEEFTKITLPLGSLEIPQNVKFTITFVLNK